MSSPDSNGPRAAPFRSDAVIGTLGSMAGLRNGPALVALVVSLFSGVLVSGLSSRLGLGGALLGALLFLAVATVGINAAGLLQVDAARGAAPRRLADAFLGGVLCIPRLLLLGVALLAVALAIFVVLAIAFVFCKLPLIGPLLYLVAFPASVLVAGVTLCGLALAFVLALPAIWQGMSALRALAQALAMLRERAIEVLLSLVLLAILCAAVAAVIGVVLGVGLVPAVGLTAAILGASVGSYESMLAITQGYGGASHAIAALLGGGLLWALAVSLIAQVYLRGLVLLEQRASEEVDPDGAETALRQRLDSMRRRASAWHERARAAAMPERNPAPASFTAPTPASYAEPAPVQGASAAAEEAAEAVAATDPPVTVVPDGRIEPTWAETLVTADADQAVPAVPVESDVAGAAQAAPSRLTTAMPAASPSASTQISTLSSATAPPVTSPTPTAPPPTATTPRVVPSSQPSLFQQPPSIPTPSPSAPAPSPEPTSSSPESTPPLLSPSPLSSSAPTSGPAPGPSPKPAPTPPTRPATGKLSCPKCAAKVSPQDVFCGVCGQRLR